MKRVAQLLSGVTLVATLLLPILFFTDRVDLAQTQRWLLVWTIVWFVATPLWMEHKATG